MHIVSLDSHFIEQSDYFNYPGIIPDLKLSFKTHIDHVAKNNKTSGFLYRNKSCNQHQLNQNIVKGTILPIFNYHAHSTSYSESALTRLIPCNHSSPCAALDTPRRTHHSNLYINSNLSRSISGKTTKGPLKQIHRLPNVSFSSFKLPPML